MFVLSQDTRKKCKSTANNLKSEYKEQIAEGHEST